jgi:hypothetical protein
MIAQEASKAGLSGFGSVSLDSMTLMDPDPGGNKKKKKDTF